MIDFLHILAMACLPLGPGLRWVKEVSLEDRKINHPKDRFGHLFCEVSRCISLEKCEHQDSANLGNRISRCQVGL